MKFTDWIKYRIREDFGNAVGSGNDSRMQIQQILIDLSHVNNIVSNPQRIHTFSNIGDKIRTLSKLVPQAARTCGLLLTTWQDLSLAVGNSGNSMNNQNRGYGEPENPQDQRMSQAKAGRLMNQYYQYLQQVKDMIGGQ